MSGNRFKLGLFGRVERLPMVPGVFHRRNDPEVTFGITHNPMPGRPLYKQGRFTVIMFRSSARFAIRKPNNVPSHVAFCSSIRNLEKILDFFRTHAKRIHKTQSFAKKTGSHLSYFGAVREKCICPIVAQSQVC
jgi:hypothetical protein